MIPPINQQTLNISSILMVAFVVFASPNLYPLEKEFEPAPTFQVEDVIPENLIEGSNYKVRDKVSIVHFGYQFEVKYHDTELSVWSIELLKKRINESTAIGKLNEISRTQAFITSIATAAKNPVMSAWNVATKPVSTIKGLPGGASRYLKGAFYRLKKTTKDVSEAAIETGSLITDSSAKDSKTDEEKESISQKATELTDDASKEHLGFNKAKREWAKRMKVDPYSDNLTLQEALERIAWATSLGSFAADVTVPSIASLDYANEAQNLVWDTSPIELERQNNERLMSLGLPPESIRAFHEHEHYKITAKTGITLALENIGEINGLERLLDMLLATIDRNESMMLTKIVAILQAYHERETKLKRIEIRRSMITAIDIDETLVLPIAIEYLHWTRLADEIARDDDLQKNKRKIWLLGTASDRSIASLQDLDWALTQNALIE